MSEAIAIDNVRALDAYMDAPDPVAEQDAGPVVIVSDSLPERNGVGAYYWDLLGLLEDAGCKATILCPSEKRPTLLRFPLPGDPTQRIWIPSLFRFRRIMKTFRPKAVIVATPGPYGLLGAWWARRLGAKLIVGFHTHFSSVTDVYNNRFLRAFSRFYFSIADKILFRYGDLVLANSEAMVDLARSLGARNVGVMGTLLPRDSLREPDPPSTGKFDRVIFAGRLAPEKRVQTVIDAARQLPGIRFTIAGDGPLRKDVERQAASIPNLDYLGWVSRERLLAEMDKADMLVLNSVVESFGTVALEAMARERLTLVSPTCGIVEWPDLVDNLYQVEDGESLADAMRRISALPAESRAAVARGAREAALRLNRGSLLHWLDVIRSREESPVAKS